MAQEYASKQPQGFKNHVEKVAIVGVSWVFLQDLFSLLHSILELTFLVGRRQSRQIHCRSSA
jgi:hypothetical protein